ncbi:MAG: hypothetical protein KDD38_06605 [Bdellovibrionales bacterium]|nr:hypothetical protein [Bdellovibrionales bacterium]
MKKRIVVVCPGRGSYTAETLGYIKNHKMPQLEFMNDIDHRRRSIGEPTISELDQAQKFSPSVHTKGEHASALIYASSYHDFMSIDRDQYEISAICGNSMGWYLALAFSGALDFSGAFQLIQTMGSMMKTEIIGGQIIYPVVDEEWQPDYERESRVLNLMEKVNREKIGEVYTSIWLGGYIVLGGDRSGLQYMLKNLPKSGDYPFQLINHAAFHTPLLFETARQAEQAIPQHFFSKPKVPLIDGRGVIWQPYSTDVEKLYEYTLGHQVYAPYDFTSSVTVALKEFMPDYLWLLGPGASLGGAIGQILVKNRWRGINNKNDFKEKSKEILMTS